MKKNRILNIASIVIVIAMFAFTSCEKQKKNTPKPIVKNLELGIKNSHEAYIGADIHIEADIEAEGIIEKIMVEIHPKGAEGQEIEKTYTEFVGKRNTNFHKHIDIPKDAKAGDYHLHFTVTDQAGNKTSIEENIKIKELADTEAPVITVSDAPAEGKGFATGETISISGKITDNTVLGGLLIALVKESDNVADKDVSGKSKNVIIMMHTHDFESPSSHNFKASIKVGAEKDNNMTPAPIAGENAWRKGKYYILVKTKDAKKNSAISKRYPIVLN